MSRKKFTKVIVLIACLIFILQCAKITNAWQIEILDSPGEDGGSTSLALDSSGNVHISYYGDGFLKYVSNASGSWVVETIDAVGSFIWEVIPCTSLAIDSNDKAHIAYYKYGLKYATNAPGFWVAEAVGEQGESASLSLDSNDKAHITSLARPFEYPDFLSYATNASGSWVIESLNDAMDGVTHYGSLTLDSNDKLHLSYGATIIASGLKYTTNVSGSWMTETVDPHSGNFYNSLALDSMDKVHVSYSSNLKYATNISGLWTIETVVEGFVKDKSIALDSSDKVHIGFRDGNTIKYASNASGVWTIETVDTASIHPYLFTPFDISFALDSAGRAHISYYDSTGGNLKYAMQCFDIDFDCDEVLNDDDNCSNDFNPNQEDGDNDGTGDVCDNCPVIPNGPDLGICRDGSIIGASCETHEDCGLDGLCELDICEDGTVRGTSCTCDGDCGTDGNCYLDQEEDACNCVSSFDCDLDVDGGDAARFKMYFGNGPYKNPCNIYPCEGDFDCDIDVDGTDAAMFKQSFGRGALCSADYSASCFMPCFTCFDGIYVYTCVYE